MVKAIAVAKLYNQQVNQGGRSSPDQHLSDLQRETTQQQLLNVKRQRGFTSPQQDFAYKQQEISQQKLANVSKWEGYQSKDQYLNSLQREQQAQYGLNQMLARRAELVKANTQAAVAHTNVTQGTNKSAGQLASQGTGTAVSDAQATLKQITDQIARARTQSTGQDSGAVIGQLQAVSLAIKQIRQDAKGLDIQPKGLNDLTQGLADAQAAASRAFPDIEAKSKTASDGIKGHWQSTSNSFRDTFMSMRVSAEDAAKDVEGRFAQTAAAIKGSFSGLGGGGGGGFASVFGDMANTVGSLAQNIPGMVGLITAAILALIQILPAMAAGLGAVGSAAATLPDFLGAAGGAFVTFQAAIMPVIQALGKYAALLSAQEAVQAGTISTIMQQEQAYHSLADAQFSLTQAVVQGGNQQVTSAHAVADAQFSLKEAYFQAGITQVQSSMQVASAQHALQDANFSVAQSQYALNIAWQQARFQLQQLELTVSSASLNLRGAQLNLEQAQQNYATVMAASTSTALDRAQAAYQIQVAEQALKQVTLTNTENEKQLANVRKYGMQQVFGVTQAQHSLADAQFAQVQSQKQLIITEKEAANAQIQSAHAIMDAIFGTQQARFQEAQGAVQSAHSISDAQFSVSQAQLQLKQDAQAGGAAAASAYDALQVALSQLSPAARQAVKDLEPIFVWWTQNTKAQQAFFGVFDQSLQRLGSHDVGLIKPLNDMLDAIAHTLGTVGGKFVDWLAKLANSPMWGLFTRTSVSIISSLGDGALAFAQGLAEVAKIAAPLATWIADGIARFGQEFLKWANTEAKPGSMLHLLLNEAKPALQAVEQLLKSVVIFFGILAGGTPTYNKQGVLTGVIPSDAQTSAFRTFLILLGALSNNVLPTLALVLNKLASPQLANALINLLESLSTLLLQVVSSPGFLAGFTTFVNSFAVLVGLFGNLVSYTPLGNLIGVLAGAFVAISVLKFTGVLALLTNLGKIKDWIGGIRSAEGIFGKLGAVFGGGGGLGASAQTAADTLAGGGAKAGEALITSATEAANILATGGARAGAEEAAGGAQGSAGMAAGGAAGGGSRFAAIGRAGLGLAVADLIARALIGLVPRQSSQAQRQATAQGPAWVVSVDKAIFGNNVVNFVAWWDKNVKNPVDNYIKSLPPMWGKAWANVGDSFMRYIGDPVANFFSKQIPNWLGGAGQGWQGLWDNAQNLWMNDIWHPLDNFFTNTVPGWFSDVGKFWSNLWTGGWSTFQKKILNPVEGWFAHTLPSVIEGAFKNSLNWVITNVLDKVIGWINDATKLVGIPAIPKVPTLASGGMMPRQGGGPRQDNRLVRVSDGEFIVNAGATSRHRDLLEAVNAQGFAGGGGVGGFFSGLWSSLTSGAGDLWGSVSSLFSGAGSALGKLKNLVMRDGAVPVVNAMWGHLVDPLLNAAGVNAQTEKSIIPHLVGFLAGNLHKGLDGALASVPGGAMPGKGGVSGNVASYAADIASVLKQLGEPAADLAAVEHRMTQESGGNATVVNRWDSNWLAGHPSVGLMQVIQGTFDAYAGPYRNVGPFEYGVSVDPMANIFSGVNYAKHAYSEPLYDVMMQPGGYHEGGPVHNRTHHRHHRTHHHTPKIYRPGPLGLGASPFFHPGPFSPQFSHPMSGASPDLSGLMPLGPEFSFFAGGGFAGLPGLSLAAPRAPAMAMGGSVPQRALSDAGASGKGSGFNVGDITINNPIREPAGESLTRAVMKLQFLAGRGPI